LLERLIVEMEFFHLGLILELPFLKVIYLVGKKIRLIHFRTQRLYVLIQSLNVGFPAEKLSSQSTVFLLKLINPSLKLFNNFFFISSYRLNFVIHQLVSCSFLLYFFPSLFLSSLAFPQQLLQLPVFNVDISQNIPHCHDLIVDFAVFLKEFLIMIMELLGLLFIELFKSHHVLVVFLVILVYVGSQLAHMALEVLEWLIVGLRSMWRIGIR